MSKRPTEKAPEQLKTTPEKLTNQRSEKILSNLKKTKYKELFDIMDSDNDGIISANSIYIKGLAPKILEIIAPVLYEMEEFQFQLNFSEFQQALDRLVKVFLDSSMSLFLFYKQLLLSLPALCRRNITTSPDSPR